MRVLRHALLALGLLICCGWAAAQQPADTALDSETDLKVWDSVASRAETSVDERTDSTEVFENLRARIAQFRAQFAKDRLVNSERIATLRAQIQALEPVALPDGDKDPNVGEPSDIVARRTELEKQLEVLMAPVQVADEAYRRADGLIREIDQIVRDRKARKLLSLGPSPLDPRHLPIAIADSARILGNLAAENQGWRDPSRRSDARNNLPLVIFLLALATLLIMRGRRWAGYALKWLSRTGQHGTSVWRFLVSLLRIILPLTGLFLLVAALRATGLAGTRVNQILEHLPIWGAVLLGFRWLAERLFPSEEQEALILLTRERRSEARFYLSVLSVIFVLRGIIQLLTSFEDVAPETEAVLAFPIVVLTGIVLGLFGRLLRSYNPDARGDTTDDGGSSLMARVMQITGAAAIAVAVAAPVMAAIGYSEAGNALLYPMVSSLLLLGLVTVLQRFLADLYGLVTRQGEKARDALIPVLAGFLLMLAALPLLALIWGARVADLTEIWTIFKRGYTIGGTQISPTVFLTFAAVFAIGYALTRLVQSVLRSTVLPKTHLDRGGQNALVSGLGYVGIFLAAMIAITAAGIDLTSLAFVAGALSLGIGFGLQNIVSNFVSGIILLIERPISEGDWIEVGGEMGYVRDISVRSTRIETFDRTDVIVPNSELVSGRVTNYTRGNTVGRLVVRVGVAYGTDTRRVDTILREIAEAQPMVLANPPPMILFNAFGADALEFEIRVILRDVNWIMAVKNDINHLIAERFTAEGIEVPFAQRDIWLRNPEALKGVTE